MRDYPKPNLIDQHVIERMLECERFPIPEMLVGRVKYTPYTLRIDSLIKATYSMAAVKEWANYRPELDAPYCS